MAIFKYKVKNDQALREKPRVCFTSHPEDFGRYFEKVCADVLGVQDCTIYYTEDMTEELSEENLSLDLHRMNLFVVPVTHRLLTEDCRAMTVDIPYAMENGIPILPLMMEDGITDIYSRPDRFGERQYISPFSTELTEIAYEKKLGSFLEAVLTDGDTAARVRGAFAAYVFLSYRKKDRTHANELMRIIHSNPKYRDIAIWYDEFLTPGESFRENISRALSGSRLFALLVTPSLLEIPNFVMDEEYPVARRENMRILPIEMASTDRATLAERYDGIPECATPSGDLYGRLADMLADVAPIHDEPEHNFLIGLAYLYGIDVELDRDRGMELITSAAEAGLLEAMHKLYDLYRYEWTPDSKDLYWAKRIYERCTELYGEEHPDTLDALNSLATEYSGIADFKTAFELFERGYEARRRLLGEEHPDTLESLRGLAYSYANLGDKETALALHERVCEGLCKTVGVESFATQEMISHLLGEYERRGDIQKELDLRVGVMRMNAEHYGEEHNVTVKSMLALASLYKRIGEEDVAGEMYECALSLAEISYSNHCEKNGSEHPEALEALTLLADACNGTGDKARALELYETAYPIYCRVFGEDNLLTSSIGFSISLLNGEVDVEAIASLSIDEMAEMLFGDMDGFFDGEDG